MTKEPDQRNKTPSVSSFSLGMAMGFNRARAIDNGIKIINGEKLSPDLDLNLDDFRCDAEQVEIDENGVIRKSAPPSTTRP